MAVTYEQVRRWIEAFASRVAESRDELTRLDSAIGDADHGINMNRGMQAVVPKLDGVAGDDVGALLKTVGMTLVSTVGGAGGPLYGTLFLQLGTATAGKSEIGAEDWAAALKAEPGDKTMIDALIPGRDAFRASVADGASFSEALELSAAAAHEGMLATVPLVARKGRASYLGERSAGHQDPGATSSHLLLLTAAETWKGSD